MLTDAREILEQNDILIAYRWDPDSLGAAIILAGTLANKNKTTYFTAYTDYRPGKDLLEKLTVKSRMTDALVLIGPGWQGPEIDLVARNIYGPVLVVDNSYTYLTPKAANVVFFNPSPHGDPRSNWPSKTFIAHVIAGESDPLLVAASISFLLGEKAKAHRRFQDFMIRAGLNHKLDYEEAWTCAKRLLGVTITQTPRSHESMPRSIVDTGLPYCLALLNDPILASYEAVAESIVEDELEKSRKEIIKNMILIELDKGGTPLLLYTARILSQDTERTVFALTRRENRFEACVWSPLKPLQRLVGELRRSGIAAFSVYQGLINYLCMESRKEALEKATSIVSSYTS